MIFEYHQLKAKDSFFILAGPCVVESADICFHIAEHLYSISQKLQLPWAFKASFKKANRSRLDSYTGPGDDAALKILADIKSKYQVPIVTDIHETADATMAAEVADILQIPAFLCRQTDLLVAAGKTGKIVNIKKGQFAAPSAMKHAADKIIAQDNPHVMLTERGTTFGYQDLVVDFRGIVEMSSFGFPVILDVTHSLQQPNQASGVTGGLPHLIETMALCGISAGVHGLFFETHPEPSKALSDGANMIALNQVEKMLVKALSVRKAAPLA